MNNCINLAGATKESIPATKELLAAREALDQRIKEAELAQKAVKEAEDYLNLLAADALKAKANPYTEGEVIHVLECNRLFYYYNGNFQPLPAALDFVMKGESLCSN